MNVFIYLLILEIVKNNVLCYLVIIWNYMERQKGTIFTIYSMQILTYILFSLILI